jgi:hypothetical protein
LFKECKVYFGVHGLSETFCRLKTFFCVFGEYFGAPPADLINRQSRVVDEDPGMDLELQFAIQWRLMSSWTRLGAFSDREGNRVKKWMTSCSEVRGLWGAEWEDPEGGEAVVVVVVVALED